MERRVLNSLAFFIENEKKTDFKFEIKSIEVFFLRKNFD